MLQAQVAKHGPLVLHFPLAPQLYPQLSLQLYPQLYPQLYLGFDHLGRHSFGIRAALSNAAHVLATNDPEEAVLAKSFAPRVLDLPVWEGTWQDQR